MSYAEGELVNVVVRLPRKAINDSLLAIPVIAQDLPDRQRREVKAMLAGRRERKACFQRVRFHDPSWDMILELYLAGCENRHISITNLCRLSGGSMTTALRHIEHLEALGYLRRINDTTDRRRTNVSMLPKLSFAVEKWLEFQRAEIAIGCLA